MTFLRRVVPLLLLGLTVFGAGPTAEEPRRPRYSRLLEPPMRHEIFRKPRSVTADLHTGEVFVCDTMRHRIVIFDKRGVLLYQINGGSSFRAPLDIAVHPEGYLFVVGRHQGQPAVIKLDFDGQFLGVLDFAALAELENPIQPMSVAISPSGDRLYVVDVANHLLIIADGEGIVETTVDLIAGMEPELSREQIYAHVDAYADTVLVARPTLGTVHLFAPDGEPRGHVGLYGTGRCQSAFPMAAALDDQGHVLILDQRRMLFTLWDPSNNKCLDEFYGMGMHPGGLYAPEDLTLDAGGRVYIAQTREGRIQVYEGGWPAALPAEANEPAETPAE